MNYPEFNGIHIEMEWKEKIIFPPFWEWLGLHYSLTEEPLRNTNGYQQDYCYYKSY